MCCCSTPRVRALTIGSSSAQFSQSYSSPMDAECPTANVQPTIADGATPSGRSHCATDARTITLEKDRARRRERLASETAEEKERRLAQRRVRDRARRASRSSPVSETGLEQWRSAEQRRRAVESSRQREAHHARYRLNRERRLAAQDPEQVKFRDILLRLRDAKVTLSDCNYLMSRTPTRVHDLSPFSTALHLIPTVVEYKVAQLQASGQPIATIKAVHTGANAAKAPADDAGGLEAVVCLAHSARVMLTSNLWVDPTVYTNM